MEKAARDSRNFSGFLHRAASILKNEHSTILVGRSGADVGISHKLFEVAIKKKTLVEVDAFTGKRKKTGATILGLGLERRLTRENSIYIGGGLYATTDLNNLVKTGKVDPEFKAGVSIGIGLDL